MSTAEFVEAVSSAESVENVSAEMLELGQVGRDG